MNNYTAVNWKIITDSLDDGVDIIPDLDRWQLATPGYLEIYKMWEDAQFNKSAIKWTNYYPDKHFSQALVDDIALHLQLNGVHRSWISKVEPGYFAPLHWDVDDNEAEYLKHGPIKRYSIMLSGPTLGHIFILGDQYLVNSPMGAVIEWTNYKEWHSGINAGMTPKYMFHILGY